MKNGRIGFSLLEISIVIFIMGITITALLQMLEFGHLRYNAISSGIAGRSAFAEARLWLRDKIVTADLDQIKIDSLQRGTRISSGFRFTGLKVKQYDDDTFLIQLGLFEDRNNNGNPDKNEFFEQKLFCFRRRS